MNMNPIRTNEIMVMAVDQQGVLVAVNGTNKPITWAQLREAASQPNKAGAVAYSRILAMAEEMAATGPVKIEVCRDSTNVWWVCRITALYGGGPADYGRAADEGGTLPYRGGASWEARDIARRLGKRVALKVGF